MSNDMKGMADLTAQLKTQADANVSVQDIHHAIANSKAVTIHPDADLFPMMGDEDADGFAGMVEDIKSNGVNIPIVIDKEGKIVDGRNRLAAIAKIVADGNPVPDFKVSKIPEGTNVRKWILSTNLHRRHLTTSQRAMIASQLVTATKASGGANSRTVDAVEHVTTDDAAKAMGVSARSVKKATAVVREAEKQGKPEIVKDVKAGKSTVSAAATKLSPPKASAAKPQPAPKPAPAVVPETHSAKKGDTSKKGSGSKKGKPAQAGLTTDELATVKELLVKASPEQRGGLVGYLKGVMKTPSTH